MILTVLMLAAFLAAAVIPMETFHELLGDTHFQVGEGENARLAPVTRIILLFGIGSFAAYFGGFTVILGILGWIAVARWSTHWLPRILSALLTAGFGGILIALKAVIHH